MPAGLVPVNARLKAPRRTGRLLACVLMAAAVLVASLEFGLLPGRLGQQTAAAQTPTTIIPPSFTQGTPNPCPTTPVQWSPAPTDGNNLTASECVLALPACPVSPVKPPELMWLSVPAAHTTIAFPTLATVPPVVVAGLDLYPEFCEERFTKAANQAHYDDCIALTGYIVMPYNDGGDACRVLTPIACPGPFTVGTKSVGLHRSGSQSCRAVQRRGWTCAAGYLPSNTFNSCYLRPSVGTGPHPACEQGAPDFPLLDCARYVDEDFLANPASVACATDYPTDTDQRTGTGYPTGTPVPGGRAFSLRDYSRTGPSSHHWCEFDTAALDADCHRTGGSATSCTATYAACLKRSSKTGGCNRVAETIRCRAHQAAFAQNALTDSQVREQGCDPCQTLPFSAAPAACSHWTTTRTGVSRTLQRIMNVGEDFAFASRYCTGVNTAADLANNATCRQQPVCADPPKGRVDWASRHHSALAVAQVPVVVRIEDIPIETRTEGTVSFDYRTPGQVNRDWYNLMHFTDATAGGLPTRLTTFSEADPNGRYTRASGFDGRVTSECTTRFAPVFNLKIEELWPDHSRDEIEALFGTGSLAWWPTDVTRQKELTAARGLGWWADLTTAERDERQALLTTEVECARHDYRTCDWLPPRPGYFKLVGVGAWQMTLSSARQVRDGWTVFAILGSEGNRGALNDPNMLQRVRAELGAVGRSAADIGLKPDASEARLDLHGDDPRKCNANMNPHQLARCPRDHEALFTQLHAATSSCSSIDIRILCSSGDVGNVTRTDPVGVIVHEVRVSTVAPSRP